MKILFLCHRVPYPPDRGDRITTWHFLRHMLDAGHEVRLGCFSEEDRDEESIAFLRTRCQEVAAPRMSRRWRKLWSLRGLVTGQALTVPFFADRRLRAMVDRWRTEWKPDLVYVYSSSMAQYVLGAKGAAKVMHFAELDSDKWRQYAARSHGPMRWLWSREARTLLEFERRIAAAFDASILCTPLEQEVFARYIPGVDSLVLRNGVDLDYFRPHRQARREAELVFTGVMDYEPNVDGVEWFARDILPLIRQRVPAARFTIVGSKPVERVQRLAAIEGVTVTGRVEDVRAYVHAAAVSVAPLRIARGIQNKVLEAMACGVPVVGTTSATQGVECVAGRDLLVRDAAADFADEVVRLLQDPLEAEALGARGRALVEERYAWERVLQPLDALVTKLIG